MKPLNSLLLVLVTGLLCLGGIGILQAHDYSEQKASINNPQHLESLSSTESNTFKSPLIKAGIRVV